MIYVGLDECNHGGFPEIFVGTFSQKPKHVSKTRRKKERVPEEIRKRLDFPHFFYELSEKVSKGVPQEYLMSLILYSLTKSYLDKNPTDDYISFFIDGLFPEKTIKSLEEVLRANFNVSKIVCEAKLDEKRYLVNTADALASLYFHLDKQERNTSPHKTELLLPSSFLYL